MRDVGMIIVVGGPQYRVGSHRQFTQLARTLAADGWPVLRFDVRGMGDSSGEFAGFEAISPDIAAATDALLANLPSVHRVVLWGLCDGASAALLYMDERADSRIVGLGLVNPWVRSAEGLARARVKHYYAKRLLQHDFWKKLVSGGVRRGAIPDLFRSLGTAMRGAESSTAHGAPSEVMCAGFQDRMLRGLQAFSGPVWLATSGRDLTAQEFLDQIQRSTRWRNALSPGRCQHQRFEDADHTFSDSTEMERLHSSYAKWINASWPGRAAQLAQTGEGDRFVA